MEVTLGGRRYELTQERVETVKAQPPRTIQRYAVLVGGVRYPLKQAAACGLDAPPAAFTSQQAYGWLTKLGFDVIDTQGRTA